MSLLPLHNIPLPQIGASHPWLDTLRPERLFGWNLAQNPLPDQSWKAGWAIDPDHFEELRGAEHDGRVITLDQLLRLREMRVWGEPIDLADRDYSLAWSVIETRLGKTISAVRLLVKGERWWAVTAQKPERTAEGKILWIGVAEWVQGLTRGQALRTWKKKKGAAANEYVFLSVWDWATLDHLRYLFARHWSGREGRDEGAFWHGRIASPGQLSYFFKEGLGISVARPRTVLSDAQIEALTPHQKYSNTEKELSSRERPRWLSDSILDGAPRVSGLLCDAPQRHQGSTWLDVSDPRSNIGHPWNEQDRPINLMIKETIFDFESGAKGIRWQVQGAEGPEDFMHAAKNPTQRFYSMEHLIGWAELKKKNEKEWSKKSLWGARWAVAAWEFRQTSIGHEWVAQAKWVYAPAAWLARLGAIFKLRSYDRVYFLRAFTERELALGQAVARRVWTGFAEAADESFSLGAVGTPISQRVALSIKGVSPEIAWEAFQNESQFEPGRFKAPGCDAKINPAPYPGGVRAPRETT